MIAAYLRAHARALSIVVSWLGVIAFALLPGMASALPRAWVSAQTGVDAGSCTLSAPCRTFTYAIVQVDAGGEVNALDSGGYGAMTITKAVTVNIASGLSAAILAATGNAVTISAGATDRVVLRGLVISSPAGNGIVVNSVGRLQIENSELNGNNMGIVFASATAAKVVVADVILRSYSDGIKAGGALPLDLDLDRVQIIGSAHAGIVLGGPNVRAVMRRSSIFGSLYGVIVDCQVFGAAARMIAEESVIGDNAYGVYMNAVETCTSELTLSGNLISNNGTGIYFAASVVPPVVFTRTNNTFTNNSSDVGGAPPLALTQLAAQ
jgi:hypothetical protein